MTKHTQGPWRVDQDDPFMVLAGERFVATCERRTTTAEDEANARLVASAPDLLTACKDALAALEREHRERQARADQSQDEWNHRHADDPNVPNDCAMFCGVEVEEAPVLAVLRAAISKATGFPMYTVQQQDAKCRGCGGRLGYPVPRACGICGKPCEQQKGR